MPVRRSHRLVYAKSGDGKVTREYREDDDELIEGQTETTTSTPSQEQQQGGAQYIDELPDLVCFVLLLDFHGNIVDILQHHIGTDNL